MPEQLYVIPDIHGQRALLETALARIEADGGANAKIVFLGDYVDRGPDSRGVIETLISGQAAGRDWVTLRGNHDQLFLTYLEHGMSEHPRLVTSGYTWLHERMGGVDTLASYGVTASARSPNHEAALEAIPDAHRDWLATLPCYHLTPDLLLAHAGIRPGVPLDRQVPEDLMWIRTEFHRHTDPYPWLVVHGHTPVERPRHFGNRIDLDGGAGWGGPLWPAVFEGRSCWLLTDTGREALTP